MRSELEARTTPIELTMVVNGERRTLRVPPLRRLLDVLRLDLKLTGSKEGCGEGECGACTVLVDGQPVLSCIVPACQAEGTEVVTIEGVAPAGEGADCDAVQDAFVVEGGAQCGICTPGMIVMTRAYLERCERDGVAVTEQDAREALSGNLCRCTGYGKILASVLSAARERGQDVEDPGGSR